ncbi:MSP4/5-related [Plasmodium yoelii yoelii]|uniref:MSP4/5-related n=1 Tax=Plasmodium yoelii yoelii TaxID=73239 RepID=Q7RC17_PLAYO|nr:MSP4/5-related [Plasmodium yoelii yoelii]
MVIIYQILKANLKIQIYLNPLKLELLQIHHSPNLQYNPGNTNGDSQNSIHSDDEEEDDEDEDDDEEDCSVNNGGCGENLLCEKMESGIIKCSCPSGYKLNGTSCIELLSAHSVNYCFCGILIILIILVSMIY